MVTMNIDMHSFIFSDSKRNAIRTGARIQRRESEQYVANNALEVAYLASSRKIQHFRRKLFVPVDCFLVQQD